LVLLGEDKDLIGDDEKVELLGLGFMIKDKNDNDCPVDAFELVDGEPPE